MAGKIAQSIFTTGAKDELLTVDVYKVKDSAVKNNIVESVFDFGGEALNSIRNDPGIISDLARVLDKSSGKLTIDAAALTSRLMSAAGGNSTFSKLSNTLKGGAVNLLEKVGISPSTSIGIAATVGDVISNVRPEDLTDARGIVDVLSRITGNSEVARLLDLDAEAAFLGSILSEAMRLGIPDAIDVLTEVVSGEEVQRRFLQDNLRAAVSMSDLKSVRRIVEKIGRQAALAQIPNIIELILTFYFYQSEKDRREKARALNELVSLLDFIKPGWFVYEGRKVEAGETVTRMGVFSYASEDALDLFAISETYRTEIAIAFDYPSQDLLNMTQQMYPYVLFEQRG